MPYRHIEFQAGEYYHIYHRGHDRQKIFFENENYLYFLRLLNKYREKFEMLVIAYCLMPNHFHFLPRPGIFNNLSRFVGLLGQSYAQAINKRYHRQGNLFHNERFRHSHVYSDMRILSRNMAPMKMTIWRSSCLARSSHRPDAPSVRTVMLAAGRLQFWDHEKGETSLYRYAFGTVPQGGIDPLPDGRVEASPEGPARGIKLLYFSEGRHALLVLYRAR